MMKPFLIAVLAAMCVTTCACSGSSRTLQPTHTAAAAVTAHPRPSTPAPAPSLSSGSPAAASCLTRHLTASVGGSPQGFAGGMQIVVVFRNLGKAACTLYGYPSVAQAAGVPATAIGRPSTENPATPRTPVTLPPNGTASAMLRIADSLKYPHASCKPVKATWLAVIPPDQKTALNVSFGSTACKGNVKLLSVTTVQQGSGG